MKTATVLVATLLAATALAAGPQPLSDRQFSADLLLTPPGGPAQTHKLYFSKLRVRSEVTVGGRSMVTINDLGTDHAWMLMPEQKMAMEMSGAVKAMMNGRPGGSGQLKPQELFSGITGNPCSKLEGWTCTSLGEEKVGSRPADKWQMADKEGKTSTVWIDRELHMFTRRQLPDGQSFELRNIKVGKQPEELFQVPGDYRVVQSGVPPTGKGTLPMVGAPQPGMQK